MSSWSSCVCSATCVATIIVRYNESKRQLAGARLAGVPFMGMSTQATKQLDTFSNPRPGRDYHIAFECPEFTCLCPLTGQPDFATVTIDYVPDVLCVELKSLKTYLWSYRNEGAFHEAVTNQICDDLVTTIAPRSVVVTGKFWVRGGITTTVTVARGKPS